MPKPVTRFKLFTESSTPPSPFQRHAAKWRACTSCGLCERRQKVVLARGSLPCSVLFIGEAPGQSEDAIGKPFIGPAGKLLDHIISRALPREMRWAMTNLVGCIPLDEDGDKLSEPAHDEIKKCRPRLVELMEMAQPRLVVTLGNLAHSYAGAKSSLFSGKPQWLAPWESLRFLELVHPAAILRANVANQGLMIQRCVVNLSNIVEEL